MCRAGWAKRTTAAPPPSIATHRSRRSGHFDCHEDMKEVLPLAEAENRESEVSARHLVELVVERLSERGFGEDDEIGLLIDDLLADLVPGRLALDGQSPHQTFQCRRRSRQSSGLARGAVLQPIIQKPPRAVEMRPRASRSPRAPGRSTS